VRTPLAPPLGAEHSAASASRAHKIARERKPLLKGALRIRRNWQARTPRARQEAELHPIPGFVSERLTRLCGAGAPFRPLFYPIPKMFWDRRFFPSNLVRRTNNATRISRRPHDRVTQPPTNNRV